MERFWDKVDKTAGCWLWTASTNGWGYGAFAHKGQMRGAHVVSWELHGGRVPKGKCLLHRCDVRRCVNPDHLYVGTKKRNSRDMVERDRQAKGSRNGNALLKEERVIEICRATGNHTQIGQRFGVSRETVSQIKRGDRWGWLTSNVRSTNT